MRAHSRIIIWLLFKVKMTEISILACFNLGLAVINLLFVPAELKLMGTTSWNIAWCFKEIDLTS